MRPRFSRTPLVVIVVLGTLALALGWGGVALAGHLVQARSVRAATQRSVGEVTKMNLGGLGGFVVSWRDGDNRTHVQTFISPAGQPVSVGGPFAVRYDPKNPARALAVDESDDGTTFDFEMVALCAGVLVLLFWVVRLLRWWWGARRGEVGFAVAQVQAVQRSKSVKVWVMLTDDQGSARYQQVVWEPWLPFVPRGQRVAIRDCPGFGESFIIEVPYLGRLWPAGGAAEEAPAATDRFRLNRDPGQTVLAYLALALFTVTWVLLLHSLFFVLFIPLMVFAGWQLLGLAPPGLRMSKA